jgi:hypothetical protein
MNMKHDADKIVTNHQPPGALSPLRRRPAVEIGAPPHERMKMFVAGPEKDHILRLICNALNERVMVHETGKSS